MELGCHESIVDEEVFFDIQPCVPALQVTGDITSDAMAEDQVLRTCRRPDRVGLHEAKASDRAAQRGWRGELPTKRKLAQANES